MMNTPEILSVRYVQKIKYYGLSHYGTTTVCNVR